MLKKKKLFLNRETVRKLETEDLHEVVGGGRSNRSHCCTILRRSREHVPRRAAPAVTPDRR